MKQLSIVNLSFLFQSGIHHTGNSCDIDKKLNEIKSVISDQSIYFYPKNLELAFDKKTMVKLKKPNGGWSDLRDHLLCKSFVDFSMANNKTVNNTLQVF